MTGRLANFIAAELAIPAAPAVHDFAAAIAARGGAGTVGLLFYGSALRDNATDGLLDFYVLLDDHAVWDSGAMAKRGARTLPPNVEYAETTAAGMTLRAKIAIITLAQFREHARAKSYDTTIWARFAQPAKLVWRRDDAALAAVADAVSVAAGGAAWWAAHLGPERGTAADFWTALFTRTYSSELRVESANRPSSVVERAPERFAAMLPLAWEAEGIGFASEGEVFTPAVTAAQKADAERAWRRRKRIAKPLNLARLAKAAFTFSGGVDYIAWKIERHSGYREEITPFQRRHPILSAGPALWRLWRKGVLR